MIYLDSRLRQRYERDRFFALGWAMMVWLREEADPQALRTGYCGPRLLVRRRGKSEPRYVFSGRSASRSGLTEEDIDAILRRTRGRQRQTRWTDWYAFRRDQS